MIDAIITNFHIPRSSLMIMISAWMGLENIQKTYQYAIDHGYHFYSFGDGMMIR
ncbi:MAG: S-adenosylmethionine:tRNA ribosyltransferase-isomerase [Candidatus Peribacteria bacterium]|nr:MAG: S-adenosylmethionine:tRNA ribosyltransferase-isomerase [Candidatus Peribacteria bacterium]